MKQWFAVQCKGGEDERAEAHLERQGFTVFRPRIRHRRRRGGRMTTVVESLFPRYLFVHLDNTSENWAPIRSTRGVLGLVRFGGQPVPVPTPVIEALQQSLDPDTGCVDLEAATDYRPDQPVTITEGPFAGHEALFVARSGEERVIVLLELMQQQQRIQLPEGAIQSRE